MTDQEKEKALRSIRSFADYALEVSGRPGYDRALEDIRGLLRTAENFDKVTADMEQAASPEGKPLKLEPGIRFEGQRPNAPGLPATIRWCLTHWQQAMDDADGNPECPEGVTSCELVELVGVFHPKPKETP